MVLFDTNFVLALFKKHDLALRVFEKSEQKVAISILSVVELFSIIPTGEWKSLKKNISDFKIIPFNQISTAEKAASFRHHYKLKTADSLILATAEEEGLDFYTFDSDFKRIGLKWVHYLEY